MLQNKLGLHPNPVNSIPNAFKTGCTSSVLHLTVTPFDR